VNNYLLLIATSDFLYYLLIFIAGALVGSFLNVVSDRLLKGKSVVYGRSECEFCHKELSAKELIPVISFIVQKGKCSACGAKLSWYYPVSEILTGTMFVLLAVWLKVFSQNDTSIYLAYVYHLIIASFLIAIFLTDLKDMIIPDKIVFPAIIFVLLSRIGASSYSLLTMYQSLKADVLGKYLLKAGYLTSHIKFELWDLAWVVGGALVVSLFFLLLIFITKGRGMGGGDVKLGFLLGLINGFPNFTVMLFSAFLVGALYSVFLVILKRKGMKEAIPFGPFLIIGCYIALFFGEVLVNRYLSML
jgi:leader peptidase (prepilin peptidase)/N-methyltransferase